MRKLILGTFFLLAACALPGAPEMQDPYQQARANYATARETFNVALQSFADYSARPRCSEQVVVMCARQPVIDNGYEIAVSIDTILDGVAEGIATGADPATTELRIRQATAALAQLQALLITQAAGGNT